LLVVGAAIAIPLAAVALYFLAFEPKPPSGGRAIAQSGPARPDSAGLPPNHPPVAAEQGGAPAHPQVGSTGRAVRVPEGVRGRWEAVALRVEAKAGGAAPQLLVVKLGSEAAIPGSPLVVRAVEFLPALQVKEGEITSAGNEPTNPAALIVVSEQKKEIYRGWLFAKFPDMQPFEHPAYRIALVEGTARKQK
jgi:hypothetical protein